VTGPLNYDPNRSEGTAHTLGETEPKCMGTDPQLFDHATHEMAPGQISGSEVPLVELERGF
jgi:hypothetical protein